MNYRNTEMKLDQLVNYFNEQKINLSPAFQRGHVWPLKTRQKLIENVVQGRPIPAIFLYKEASGSRYSYNILDGKQRLESLILFVCNKRAEFKVKTWAKYFQSAKQKKDAAFSIQLPMGRRTFSTLSDDVVRDFREYAIPTIEITLTDESPLDEIISLFVDINKEGVPVGRFDIVKAMGAENKMLGSVFSLIAVKEQRQQDVLYKAKNNDITFVLKTIGLISHLSDSKAQVDRMWQQLLEIALFHRTTKHRKPVDILKSFISGSQDPENRFPPLTIPEQKSLRHVFKFVAAAYRAVPALRGSSLATDRTRFYTLVTTLIRDSALVQDPNVVPKLVKFANILDGKAPRPDNENILKALDRYLVLSSDRQTDTPRREEREEKFLEVLATL